MVRWHGSYCSQAYVKYRSDLTRYIGAIKKKSHSARFPTIILKLLMRSVLSEVRSVPDNRTGDPAENEI
jgi:hypothetical protein